MVAQSIDGVDTDNHGPNQMNGKELGIEAFVNYQYFWASQII